MRNGANNPASHCFRTEERECAAVAVGCRGVVCSVNRAAAAAAAAAADPRAMQDEGANGNESDNVHGGDGEAVVSAKTLREIRLLRKWKDYSEAPLKSDTKANASCTMQNTQLL